jgi:hypothetical protein
MKITLFHLLVLAGAFVAATESVETGHVRRARHLRRALEESDAARRLAKDGPAAIQSQDDDDDLEPTEEMIDLVGELDDEDIETTEDDPQGRERDLFYMTKCKSRCVRKGCRRSGRLFDCCKTYMGNYIAC